MSIVKKSIGQILPQKIKHRLSNILSLYFDQANNDSYSQEGEDRILYRIFEKKTCGFYVDIGAHHPKRFSNTYLFYKKGWKGINVDAMPGAMKAFKKTRPRDINLEVGVSEKSGRMDYYMFNEPALNGFSCELSKERDKKNGYKIERIENIKTLPLSEILTHYANEKPLDFLSVDVEGHELEVLKSNSWDRFRPTYVLAECLTYGHLDSLLANDPVTLFMSHQGYKIYAKTINTVFYKDSR